MLDCVSVDNMRRSDKMTIEKLISSRELIYRAALAVFYAAHWNGEIGILTGSGNNGADGYALSCILKREGYNVSVLNVSGRMHDDCKYYAEKAEKFGVPVLNYEPKKEQLRGFDMIVDCMLGTGYNGQLRPIYRQAIEEINNSNAYVICVDINSGMNGDSGAGEMIVYSDLTVTIQFLKNGLIGNPAGKYIERLICAPIGIQLYKEENKVCSESEWENMNFSLNQCNVFLDDKQYIRAPKWLDMNSIEVDFDSKVT